MKFFSEGTQKSVLKAKVEQYVSAHIGDGVYALKQAVMDMILRESILSADENTAFWGDSELDGIGTAVRYALWQQEESLIMKNVPPKMRNGEPLRAFIGTHDFGHTAPDWQNILHLGLAGLRERAVAALANRRNLTARQQSFYKLTVAHYDAAFAMIEKMARLAEQAQTKDTQMAAGLKMLSLKAPESLYEAMQTMIVYYTLQTFADDNPVRTFGRLDDLLFPFYKADLAAGRLTKESAAALTRAFLNRLSDFRIAANIPFAICGDCFGKDMSNEYSFILLEQFVALASPHIKLHFLYSEKTPEALVKMAIKGIVGGSNSIVFMNDRVVKSGLISIGAKPLDAEYYSVVGCYEPGAKGEMTCSCNGLINLGKAIELSLNCGRDMQTNDLIGIETPSDFADFESYYTAFQEQLLCLAEAAKEMTRLRESRYPYINTGAFLSSTYDSCMEQGQDVYADYGAAYNNSSINANGLATAVDSLFVIKNLVFDEKKLTFPTLCEIMRSNWSGKEALQLYIKNKMPSYGTHHEEADRFAHELLALLSDSINNVPNSKEGVFRLGAFSVDNRFYLGESTAATPDGRASGEPISKNLTANPWGDKEGITAHILSVSALNGDHFPNGSVLDLVLHKSAVRGNSGEENFYKTLKVFMQRGGFAVHYNVLDPAALRDAQAKPDQYPNLQIRRCGWNVLFNTLSRSEQDEFIFMAEKQA